MRITLLCSVLLACGDGATGKPLDAAIPPVDGAPDAAPPLLTPAEQAAAHSLSPLPVVPADTTNAYADSAAAAALGQKLFFDKSYAGALAVGDDGTNGGLGAVGDVGKVACASCHAAGSFGMDDQRTTPNSVSLGTNYGTRNALGLVDSSYYTWTNWGGKFDSQWSLPMAVAENATLMNSTRLQVAHLLYAKYRTEYNAVFPTPLDAALDPAAADAARFPAAGKPGQAAFDGMAQADKDIINRIYANYGKALAAYVRKLVSGNAPFDRFVAGDTTAISPAAVRGFKLFVGKQCTACHSGPAFTDNGFHALGVPQTGTHSSGADTGRFADVAAVLVGAFNTNSVFSDNTSSGKLTGVAQAAGQTGQFRTKGLRNVATSAPYMHTGQLATLADVIDFYDQGGGTVAGITTDALLQPLSLTAQDKADLVAFLGSLTGEPPPLALLIDTSK